MTKKLLTLLLFLISFTATFSQAQSYYDDVDKTLTGIALKNALTTKITTTHTNKITYTPGAWEASKITDVHPTDNTKIILIYGWENGSDRDDTNDNYRDIRLQDTGNGDSFRWNREHVFSKSLANPRFTTDDPGPGTDAHNLRPADRVRNSTRSNFKFGEGTGNSGFSSVTYSGPNGPNTNAWYPGDEWKGDVARMMMYMYVRYEKICLPTEVGVGNNALTPDDMIDLFLKWNVEDPVSDLEKKRNTYHENTTNTYAQGNRNPFIDNPYLATRIWGGDSAQDLWGIYTSSDTEAPTTPTNVIANNTTTTSIDISWTASTDNTAVTGYNIYLNNVLTKQVATTSTIITRLTPNTSYNIQIEAKDLINNKSAKSSVINSRTLQDTSNPSVPTNLTATNISGTTFKLTWNLATDNTAVTGYDIFINNILKTSTTNLTYTTITGLTKSTTYIATVLAKDAANNKSAQSTALNVTTTDGSSNGITELFISEYIEGTANNKAIEIVNLSNSVINLTGYTLKKQSNGYGAWDNELDLSSGTIKSINPLDVFVIINSKSDNAKLLAEADLVVLNDGNPPYGAPVNFNGNDALGLFKDDVLIDIVGVLDETAKNFENKTLRRKATISVANSTYNANEWNSFPVNTVDNIGTHTSTLSVNDFDYTKFKMYPNPLKGSILNITQAENQKITALKIYTLNGKEIFSIKNPKNTVNLKGLKNSLYIVKIISNEKIGYQKLLKK